MEPVKKDPESMLPLTPAMYHILLVLADGERHGYSIMQAVAAQTEGKMRISPTTLYRSIKHLLEHKMIVETEERPDPELDDERRRYYQLTYFGWQVTLAHKMHLLQEAAFAEKKQPVLEELLGSPSYGGA